MSAVVPPELFGAHIIAKAIPLHVDDGHVIDGVGLSIEEAQQLSDISADLSSVINDVTNTIQDMTHSITELAGNMTIVSEHAYEVNKRAEAIEQVSNIVQEIADQRNLLGLIEAIEAARAGEQGKGFSVVADEIRKMATHSKDRVSEIHDITEQIKDTIQRLNTHIQEVNLESDSQSGAIHINDGTINDEPHVAFGGMKNSGLGRLNGEWSLDAFQR